MRRPLAALALILLVGLGSLAPVLAGRPGAGSAAPPTAELEALVTALDAAIPGRMRRTGTPGAAVAVVRGGELAWSKGYGLAELATRRPVSDDSLFGVASISKTATAWGVMALVEAGRIELDAPVERYVTRWRIPPSAYEARGVTIRRLLSHTAGLNTPEYLGYLPGEPRPAIEAILTDGDGRAPGLRLIAPPGERFAYSDGGYLLLQLMIEEVSGQPFDVYMQHSVLDPLGLTGATFTDSATVEARTVISYDPYGKPFSHYNFVELAPAGLYISAPDLARFVAASMSGADGAQPGRGVLAPASVALLQTPQADLRFPENLIYAHSYGLGLFIDRLPDDERLVSHMGGNLNGVTEFAALPANGEAIVVLTNSIAGHEVFADAVSAWTGWLGRRQATLPRAIRTARSILGALAGALGWAGLLGCAALLSALHAGRRQFALRRDPRPAWLRLGLGLAPLAALGVYLARVDPLLRVSMPSVAGGMALGVGGALLAALAWGLSFTPRPPPAAPPDRR